MYVNAFWLGFLVGIVVMLVALIIWALAIIHSDDKNDHDDN